MRPHSTTITGRDRRREARPISLVPIPMQLCVRPVRRDGSPRCFCTGKKTPGRAGTHTGHTGAHRHTVITRITQTNLMTIQTHQHTRTTTSTALYFQRHRSRLEDEARACISQQRAQQRAHQRWQQNRGTATPCGGYVPRICACGAVPWMQGTKGV